MLTSMDLQDPNPGVLNAVAIASGNTRERGAVPLLIQLYAGQTGPVQGSVCSAFLTLTHYQWCDGQSNGEELAAKWREWWRTHASQTVLYDSNHCPDPAQTLPALRETPHK